MTEDPLSVDYWIKHNTFGMPNDYKDCPYYSEAKIFWSNRICSLFDIYKDRPKVVEFINNITVIKFHEKDDCYTIIGIIKLNCPLPEKLEEYYFEYYHKHFSLIYDPNMIMRKQITITDYDGFTYDMALRIKYEWDYMFDMEDQNAIDEELYDDFSKMTGYKDIKNEEFSTIFTRLFDFFNGKIKIKF